MRWSESGNPVIRVPARGTRFIERQGALPHLEQYGGAGARGADMERLTAQEPMFGAYIADENGGAIELADGYHRRYYAEREGQDVYIEIEAAEDQSGRFQAR